MPDQTYLKTVLNNGMTVILKEIHKAPVVSMWNWYKVGSRNEIPGITGASHLLEHMVGTRFRYQDIPIFPLIDRLGGVYNAATSLDFTTYYATVPEMHALLFLEVLYEQMKEQVIGQEEFSAERTVVISERQWHENEPLFLLGEELQAAAFRVHSYHHEVIGDLADLQTLQRDDLYQHYRRYYIPNNAVLAVAGDFQTEAMLARIRELFETIPAGPDPDRRIRTEPPQLGERRVIVEGPGETTYIQFAHHVPQATHPDFFPLTVLDSLLTGASSPNMFGGGISNKTSRLYRVLVEGELAVSVFGGFQATIDPFLHNITIIVHPKHTVDEVLQVLEEEIRQVCETPPPAAEVARAVKQARALFAYGSESITNQAFWIGFSEIFADYEWFNTYLDRLAEVTPEDVLRVAQTYLRPQNRTLGIYKPKESALVVNS